VWEGHVLTRDYPFLDLLTFQALRDWYGGAADEIGYCGGYGYPTFAIQLAGDNSLPKNQTHRNNVVSLRACCPIDLEGAKR
jgi:hypothetical protein